MDIFNALQTAVSGLQAQSYSLNNISGNIANSQTTGFKRVDTNFVDMVGEQPVNQQVSGTVGAFSRLTNNIQGGLLASGVSTNMALSGQGFFTVQTKTGDAVGQPTLSPTPRYTRRGDFQLDSLGYLVNGSGGYLTGQNYDPRTGQSTGSGPINISTASLPAKATSSVTYAANLPQVPKTKNSSGGDSDGSLLLKLHGAAITDYSKISGADQKEFATKTLSGGEITAYSITGAPTTVQLRWAKIANQNGTTPDTWNLYYLSNSKVPDTDDTSTAGVDESAATAWTNVGIDFKFTDGILAPPLDPRINNLTIDGVKVNDSVALNIYKNALTQYSATDGAIRTDTAVQDGYASGSLTSLSVSTEGKIIGTYSNGNSAIVAQAGVAQFKNPNALKADTTGNFSATLASGEPTTGLNGTIVAGGQLEQSNTDVAGEFSKMIVTQQAYSANTRVMSTAQTMMSDLINIIR
ncbi:flagellar hook protein FlgE [Methylobacterium gossipiicola]|uniref:Flagellar hook protein FlgE n=1 Tax=Methylobacterium gossipiicola TaxID=582675 RepID=A0A1I2S4Z9_9HYPH|nr:flagellar hook-basal body complex protein [Methylobacterium gossipiicola]SFG47868.1 flagellar hook protein FlgE [Methylobacterium gossipiicola]